MKRSFNIKYGRKVYDVEVKFERIWVDDSFIINGTPCGHWEANLDTLDVLSCADSDGNEYDMYDGGILDEISMKVWELVFDDNYRNRAQEGCKP